jgi:hypothetical protein
VDPRILSKRHLAGNNDTHHVIAAAIAAKRCIHSREYNRLDWRSTLRCTVAAGQQVGGLVLVLAGRYRPVSPSLSMDNAMPAVFGTGQVVTGVSATVSSASANRSPCRRRDCRKRITIPNFRHAAN